MFQGKLLRSLSTLSHVMFSQVWICLKKLFVKLAASAEGSQPGQACGAQGLLHRGESGVGCERTQSNPGVGTWEGGG